MWNKVSIFWGIAVSGVTLDLENGESKTKQKTKTKNTSYKILIIHAFA